MATTKLDTSVFTDDSGGRKRVVVLTIRGAVGLMGLGAVAVAVSVFGHVTLPGLDEPLHLPGTSRHHVVADTQDLKSGGTGSGGLSAPANARPADSTTSASTFEPTAGPATGQPTSLPTVEAQTAKPTTNPHGKVIGKPTTKPTHKPTAPPGKPTSKPTR